MILSVIYTGRLLFASDVINSPVNSLDSAAISLKQAS